MFYECFGFLCEKRKRGQSTFELKSHISCWKQVKTPPIQLKWKIIPPYLHPLPVFHRWVQPEVAVWKADRSWAWQGADGLTQIGSDRPKYQPEWPLNLQQETTNLQHWFSFCLLATAFALTQRQEKKHDNLVCVFLSRWSFNSNDKVEIGGIDNKPHVSYARGNISSSEDRGLL